MMAFGWAGVDNHIALVRGTLTSPWSDLKGTHPYAGAIILAEKAGCLTAKDGAIRPDEVMTPEEVRRCLEIVEGRAKVLQDLITSFYDLSRIEGGEYPLELQAVDLRRALEPLLAGFSAKYCIAGAALEADWQTFPALFGLAASSVLNAMYYIPAILAIWGRKRAGEEQPLVWDWNDKPGKGTLVVLLAGNVFLGTAFGPVRALIAQGIALF